MSVDTKILKAISNEVKDSINSLDIVTPSIYSALFNEHAQEHNLDIEDEVGVSEEILQYECSNILKLQEKTANSTEELSKNTNKAIQAIEAKDDKLLQEILEETRYLRQEIEKLKESVYKDELTQAFNRKWLHDNYLFDNSKFNSEGVLVLIDLNYFKQINDTHGHIIGDKVLIFVVKELQHVASDIVRYGGDEFILLFPKENNLSEIEQRIENLREKVLSKKLKAHNSFFRASFSFGLEHYKEGDILSDVINDADKKLYKDKIQIKKRIKGIEF